MKEILSRITEAIATYKEELAQVSVPQPGETDRKQFTLLLSGISTCRKVPGIPEHMGYESLFHCRTEADAAKAREHLHQMYGISDRSSLLEACRREFSSSTQYEQFLSFWVGAPLMDLKDLTEEGRRFFLECRDSAQVFYPILGEKGFYAWDINEKIGLCRKAVACGILSEEEFWELTDPWVRQAQVFYHSFQEYAVSCLCGAVYFMRMYEEDLESFFQLNLNLVRHLFAPGGVWQKNGWYVPQKREWADLLGVNPGCLITKKALQEERIGYMYREQALEDFPDSGWRFFVGDETEEYINEVENISMIGFSDICNIDPTILAYFYAQPGCGFGKTENNGWVRES